MQAIEIKRPLGGIDKHLPLIVFGLSVLNLMQTIPTLLVEFQMNDLASALVSLFGLLAFYLIYRRKKGGEQIMIFWCIVQCIGISYLPKYSIDLSQGISFPIGPSFDTKINGIVTASLSIKINIVAYILASALFFRIKNKFYYQTLKIHSKNLEHISEFETKIIKAYSLGIDKNLYVIQTHSETKNYAIQADKTDKLKFDNPDTEYIFCEIDTEKTKLEYFKSYSIKQLGHVTINQVL